MNLYKVFFCLKPMLKKELRQVYKTRRQQLSRKNKAELDQKMTKYLKDMDWSNIDCIHVFLPINSMKEPDTKCFINWVWKQYPNIVVVVPKVSGDSEIKNYRYDHHSLLYVNDWGIPEVVDGDVVSEEFIDVVLIPLLVCDKKGNRVGYGKGFYDRFLKRCRGDVQKIGLSYFEPIDNIRDVNSFDIPLDMCITPERIFLF